jgi:hypothetical protein
MIRSGARRVLVIIAALAAVSIVIGAVLGLAGGFGGARSLALGFYLVGAAAGFVGFILGTSRLLRSKTALGTELVQDRTEESRESRALATLLMVIGVGFVFIGVAFDPDANVA